MKTDLQELIDTAKILCDRLEQAAREEKQFSEDLENEFEMMSWNVFKLSEDLKMIKLYKEIQEEAC